MKMTKFLIFLIIKISMNAPFELFGCFAPDSNAILKDHSQEASILYKEGI
jgi:hypothetical protein